MKDFKEEIQVRFTQNRINPTEDFHRSQTHRVIIPKVFLIKKIITNSTNKIRTDFIQNKNLIISINERENFMNYQMKNWKAKMKDLETSWEIWLNNGLRNICLEVI